MTMNVSVTQPEQLTALRITSAPSVFANSVELEHPANESLSNPHGQVEEDLDDGAPRPSHDVVRRPSSAQDPV